jgi:hypothetical protein
VIASNEFVSVKRKRKKLKGFEKQLKEINTFKKTKHGFKGNEAFIDRC